MATRPSATKKKTRAPLRGGRGRAETRELRGRSAARAALVERMRALLPETPWVLETNEVLRERLRGRLPETFSSGKGEGKR